MRRRADTCITHAETSQVTVDIEIIHGRGEAPWLFGSCTQALFQLGSNPNPLNFFPVVAGQMLNEDDAVTVYLSISFASELEARIVAVMLLLLLLYN